MFHGWNSEVRSVRVAVLHWIWMLVGGFNQPLWKIMAFVSWMMTLPTVSGKSVKIPWFQSAPTSWNFWLHRSCFPLPNHSNEVIGSPAGMASLPLAGRAALLGPVGAACAEGSGTNATNATRWGRSSWAKLIYLPGWTIVYSGYTLW